MNVSAPPKESLNSLEDRLAAAHRRSNLRKAAAGLGLVALFGISTFVGQVLAGAVTVTMILFFVSALLFGLGAIIFWRDSAREQVPNEELKPPASPSSFVE